MKERRQGAKGKGDKGNKAPYRKPKYLKDEKRAAAGLGPALAARLPKQL